VRVPTRLSILALLGLALAVLWNLGVVWVWKHHYATPQQVHFWKIYARSAFPLPRVQKYELAGAKRRYPAEQMHAFLDRTVYDGGEALKWPAITCGTALFLCVGTGAVLDRRRRSELIRGIQVGGRRVVTVKQFNKKGRKGWFGLDVEALKPEDLRVSRSEV
jgi:hypothetical protein